MASEKPLIAEIILEASRLGHRLFRVNTGLYWSGDVASHEGSTVVLTKARRIRAGLATGGADIIGIAKDGTFISLEVKAGKTPTTDEQKAWAVMVRSLGGRAGIVRTLDEARAVLDGTSQA